MLDLPSFLQYGFMLRALAAGAAIAVVAPLIGSFLILRRYSLLADTLAHVSLVGVAVGMLAGRASLWWVLAFVVLAAIGIEYIQQRTKLFGESVLALFLSGSLAIAVILISAARGFNTGLLAVLFGNITTVAPEDLYIIIPTSAAILFIISLTYQPLLSSVIDTELALSSGIPAKRYNLLLVVLAAATITVAIRVVGALLIGALMVIPVLTAAFWFPSFRAVLYGSTAIALFAVISGLILSFYFGLASGGTIVVIALLLFASAALSRRR